MSAVAAARYASTRGGNRGAHRRNTGSRSTARLTAPFCWSRRSSFGASSKPASWASAARRSHSFGVSALCMRNAPGTPATSVRVASFVSLSHPTAAADAPSAVPIPSAWRSSTRKRPSRFAFFFLVFVGVLPKPRGVALHRWRCFATRGGRRARLPQRQRRAMVDGCICADLWPVDVHFCRLAAVKPSSES